MPARLTNPNAQAASPGLNPTSTRYFVWCICTAYQSKSPQKYPTMIHQKRSVRMARASVQSTATQAASTTFAVPLPAVASREERSPSGSSPRSSGRRFSRRLSGANSASTRMPIAQQAARQPARPMRVPSQGSRMIEPTPTPEKARLMAKPLRRTNQLGRKSA